MKDWVVIASLICGTVMVLGLAAIGWASGTQIDYGDAAQPASIIIAAVMLGRGLKNGSNGTIPPPKPPAAAVGLLLLAMLAPQLLGCGGAVSPCTVERATVEAMRIGVAAADDIVPADAEHRDALDYAAAAGQLGDELVAACEESAGRGDVAWQTIALAALRGVLKVVGTVAASRADGGEVEPPAELEAAIARLEQEVR